jgi:hypothetical protein|eukprot:2269529-Prymnesium_polylepis.1
MSIRDWLDSLKPGWAARFAAPFEELGFEDLDDLQHLDDEHEGQLRVRLTQKLEDVGRKNCSATGPHLGVDDLAHTGKQGSRAPCAAAIHDAGVLKQKRRLGFKEELHTAACCSTAECPRRLMSSDSKDPPKDAIYSTVDTY